MGSVGIFRVFRILQRESAGMKAADLSGCMADIRGRGDIRGAKGVGQPDQGKVRHAL